MNMQEFESELPKFTFCDECGTMITCLSWSVNRYGQRDWYGLGVAKCEPCSRFRIAAAGSSEQAHEHARQRRLDFFNNIPK